MKRIKVKAHLKARDAIRSAWVKINFDENGRMFLSEDLF